MKPLPSLPRVVGDRYRLEQLLGHGGMGSVYRARDLDLERAVALKIVRPELLDGRDVRARFIGEAQILARLQHPGIVAVYDYGTFPDGSAYLVMELVRGDDLRRLLQREGRLEVRHGLRILTAVCSAIEAAHREGVLHRDLKPENILLPAGELDAKVLDFGLANLVSEEVDGMIVGTPAYMAPEQLRGAVPDARADVFSLGVIAYEMLSGRLPFGGGSVPEVALAQARGAPHLPAGSLPSGLERAIRAALDPDADRRPASAQAFAHLMAAARTI